MDMDLDWNEKRKCTVTALSLPFMYLLIKVHKCNHPGRGIVSQIDDPTYKICQKLTDILNPLDKMGQSYIRDSFNLKAQLNGIKITKKSSLASLDVVALYPSIPIDKTLQIVEKRLQENGTLSKRTDKTVDQIMRLIIISLETYFKTLTGEIFKQTILGPIAGIYMAWFEENFVLK
jgi:hypothetical protein